jgi:trk system potassium uptake protein TrkA
MKQFAVLGLGKFGRCMIDELAEAGCELLVIDRDREAVDEYKDRVAACYVADAISEEVVTRLVPSGLDAAILDLGGRIVAKVESDQQAEILELVGATDIIRANREAARRVAPLLLSSMLFSYLPIGKDFVIAEIRVPEEYVGKSLVEANFRQAHRLNVIALRLPDASEFTFFAPDYRLQAEDIMLVAAKEEDLESFARVGAPGKVGIPGVFSRLFSRIRRPTPKGG